jgi:hypothetical protein
MSVDVWHIRSDLSVTQLPLEAAYQRKRGSTGKSVPSLASCFDTTYHPRTDAVGTAGFQPAPPGIAALTRHNLRHSCAGLLLASGENATVVFAQLVHRSVVLSLDVYCQTCKSTRPTVLKAFCSPSST